MDKTGNHHAQQTDSRTENQTLYVLTHRWVLNNENTWTQGRDHHTPASVGGWADWGGITLGETPNVGDRGLDAANHHGMCVPM